MLPPDGQLAPDMRADEQPDYYPRPARYWHTTIAGVGRETGKGYRPGVCTYPRAQSPTPSAFHPVRTKTSRFKDKYQLAEEKPREIPAAERGVNVGDKGLYVFERKGTALWSSVLEGMPAREEPPPVNSNWMSAHQGDPKARTSASPAIRAALRLRLHRRAQRERLRLRHRCAQRSSCANGSTRCSSLRKSSRWRWRT